jgi:hypothetical protein
MNGYLSDLHWDLRTITKCCGRCSERLNEAGDLVVDSVGVKDGVAAVPKCAAAVQVGSLSIREAYNNYLLALLIHF